MAIALIRACIESRAHELQRSWESAKQIGLDTVQDRHLASRHAVGYRATGLHEHAPRLSRLLDQEQSDFRRSIRVALKVLFRLALDVVVEVEVERTRDGAKDLARNGDAHFFESIGR